MDLESSINQKDIKSRIASSAMNKNPIGYDDDWLLYKMSTYIVKLSVSLNGIEL